MKRLGGYLALATAALACPCHLPLTLPLAVALLGGTALGAFLADNSGWVFGFSLVYFLGALLIGRRLLKEGTANGQECVECAPETEDGTTRAAEVNLQRTR